MQLISALTAAAVLFSSTPTLPVCKPVETACTTGCYPIGTACPSNLESGTPQTDTVSADTTAPKVPAPVVDPEWAQTARREKRPEPSLEPYAEWRIRRLRAGVGLAIPGAIFVSPFVFATLQGAQFSDMPTKQVKFLVATTVVGGVFLVAAAMVPNLMSRRVLYCGPSGCGARF